MDDIDPAGRALLIGALLPRSRPATVDAFYHVVRPP